MQSPQVLVVSSDPQLLAEVRAACAVQSASTPVLHGVSDFRQAVEAARSWRPHLAIVELTGDMDGLRALAREITATSPETALTGAFRPEVFPPDQSESSVMIQALRAGLQDFIRRPVTPADLDELFARLLRRTAAAPAKLGRIVSFVSNKGGVGKSTLSVNVASGLAKRHPDRVLLIDGSLQMGVCAVMLDVRPRTTIVDAVRERQRLDETLLRQIATPHPSGLDLLAAPANAVEATEVDDEIVSRILTLARRCYDYVIVDTFPLFDRIVMASLDLSDRTYVVMDNVLPTVQSVSVLLTLLDGLGYPADRQRIVLNRYSTTAGNPSAAAVADRLDRDVDHLIKHDRRVIAAANTGRPFALSAGFLRQADRAITALIRDVEAIPEPTVGGAGPVGLSTPDSPDSPGPPASPRSAFVAPTSASDSTPATRVVPGRENDRARDAGGRRS